MRNSTHRTLLFILKCIVFSAFTARVAKIAYNVWKYGGGKAGVDEISAADMGEE